MIAAEEVQRLLSRHGRTASQGADDWNGPFPLPVRIAEFYRQVGPVDVEINGYGNPYFFPRLADLWDYQGGYRYDGCSGEVLEGWNADWIVVGDEGGDPFIFSREKDCVLFAHHGEGTWDAVEAFPDLHTMAACIATLGIVVSEAGAEFTDADSYVRPEHRRRAVTLLSALLNSESQAESIVEWAGWV